MPSTIRLAQDEVDDPLLVLDKLHVLASLAEGLTYRYVTVKTPRQSSPAESAKTSQIKPSASDDRGRRTRGGLLIPIALVLAVVIGLPVMSQTETDLEEKIREAVGLDADQCQPMTDPDSRWAEGPSLSADREEPQAAVIGGNVYLVGGTTGYSLDDGRGLLTPSDELTRFDPRRGRYEQLAALPRPLNHGGVAAYRGALYVVGGYGRRTDAQTRKGFYRYDPSSNHWSRMPDLPEPRAAGAVGVLGHRMIYAGGARNSVARRDAFAFDFRTDRWSRIASMPTAREHVGAAVAGGKLYVLGGRTSELPAMSTAERYDPRTNRWERLPPMPVPVSALSAIGTDRKAIAIGGGDDEADTVAGAVQEFVPSSGEWRRLPSLRTPRHGHGSALAEHEMWVFGGSVCPYFNPTDRVERLPLPIARSQSLPSTRRLK